MSTYRRAQKNSFKRKSLIGMTALQLCTLGISMSIAGVGLPLNGSTGAALAVPHAPETPDTESPIEKPMKTSNAEETSKLDKAMAPYVAKAREGLPAIKKRFGAGIPKDEVLMLTVRVYDPDKKYEQVFVTVQKWTDSEISGNIASDVMGLKTHKMGDEITFKPEDVLDWTVEKSDGSEEGNVVGNFLNTYK